MEKWEESLQALRTVVFRVNHLPLTRLNNIVLDDARFHIAPGGVTKHHNYPHGLVIHVNEVMQNVLSMTGDNPSEELITAVIWHDAMKVKDYDWDPVNEKVIKLPHRSLIGHLAGSAMEFHSEAVYVLDDVTLEHIEHLLLSNHGRKEWGSPVVPQTSEAFILHAADMMSATGANLKDEKGKGE